MSPNEAEAITTELAPPFTVARPQSLEVPLVFNSPHSGRVYPKAFLAASRLDPRALRRSEDAYVEELFAFVTRVMTLLPGDVILTGTPAGVGPIHPGDRVEVEIEGIGILYNPVVAGT